MLKFERDYSFVIFSSIVVVVILNLVGIFFLQVAGMMFNITEVYPTARLVDENTNRDTSEDLTVVEITCEQPQTLLEFETLIVCNGR